MKQVEPAAIENHEAECSAPLSRFIRQYSGKLLCLVCTRELPDRQARFHLLHCKERRSTRAVLNRREQHE